MILTSKVYDVAVETPLHEAINLSMETSNHVLLKREDLQPIFSFKIRGAYNKMCHIHQKGDFIGVIACSAGNFFHVFFILLKVLGNHAQGVALAAKKLKMRATIIMPTCTPAIKWKNVKRLGAEVVLYGDTFDEAKKEAERRCEEENLIYVPPFDDPLIIAGQGTIAMEVMKQVQRWKAENEVKDDDFVKSMECLKLESDLISGEAVDVIFCAIGGGGMAAGITSYLKRIYPKVKIIGVEAEGANSMQAAFAAGKPVELEEVGLFADGAAVKKVGNETFRVCYGNRADKSLPPGLDDIVVVSNDEICAAIKDVFVDTRAIMEPAGALGVAGLKKWSRDMQANGLTLIAITSGANVNFDRLRFIAERSGLGEQKEALISAIIPENPGNFMKLYKTIYPRSITEFSYRYGNPEMAYIVMSFQVKNRKQEINEIFAKLESAGMRGVDLTDNELAKTHARYMVGGRSRVENERLFQFEFPERPGALKKFLEGLHFSWNVSLFHYRAYGVDKGKVLVGIQVKPDENEQFEKFLCDLNYDYTDETHNPVYEQFLR